MRDNPYIGPRPFEKRHSDRFFGREREARDLLALLMSKREVLFYAPSGAGKTSLLNACVIPKLEEEGYTVLPVARVGSELPPDVDPRAVNNIFTFSILLSLAGEKGDPHALMGRTLDDFLATYCQDENGQPRLPILIMDQFEEIFTTHRERWREAEDFFRQIRKALDTLPNLGVVMAMREDHVAAMDAYAQHFPWRLQARFRMELLGVQGALEAVRRPAEKAKYQFEANAAEKLVDNLRQIKVQDARGKTQDTPEAGTSGAETAVLGPYIEPVQLQVVCNRLWDALPEQDDKLIQWEEVEQYGNIDRALTDFYESALKLAQGGPSTSGGGVSERQLRGWFGERLITPLGTRGLVMRGHTDTVGLPNRAVDMLESQHIIRADVRAGARWYELSHDRLVEPILKSNRVWKEKQAAAQAQERPWLPVAQRWQETQDNVLLYRGKPLEAALAWQAAHSDEMEPEEIKFLEASRYVEQYRIQQKPWLQLVRYWQKTGDDLLLYRGKVLKEALTRAEASPDEMEPEEVEFLQASQMAERRRIRRRWLAIAASITAGALMVVMAILTFWATSSQQKAESASMLAEQQRNIAETAQAVALEQRDEIKRLSERHKYLSEMGWGVIFAANADPALREALSELLDHRRAQATQNHEDYYEEYMGEDGYRPGDTMQDFLQRHTISIGLINPSEVPYYLLIVGDPESIPYEFQYQLDTKYAVGRIYFETLEEYTHYARSVVKAETSGVDRPRQVTFFGVVNPDDNGTRLSSKYLVEPLYKHISEVAPEWETGIFTGDAATKAQLARLLGGDQTPGFLFTASHGMDFSLDSPKQLTRQGALVCQDWPGPRNKIFEDFYFAAEDVDEDAQLSGLIVFSFASYSAGMSKYDDYSLATSYTRTQVARSAFVAQLPQQLLGHPKGGVLAFIGQLGPGWGYSFLKSNGEQTIAGTFHRAVDQMLAGYPVGAAMEPFNQRYAELSAELSTLLLDVNYNYRTSKQFIMTLDARDYVIVGDPAVRLVIAEGAAEIVRTSSSDNLVAPTPYPLPTDSRPEETPMPMSSPTLTPTPANIPSEVRWEFKKSSFGIRTIVINQDDLPVFSVCQLPQKYIFGVHNVSIADSIAGFGGQFLMEEKGKFGWVLFTEVVGRDANSIQYIPEYTNALQEIAEKGFSIIVRLNYGYDPGGTLPESQYYDDFALSVRRWVELYGKYVHVWVIGNEPNNPSEHPGGYKYPIEHITPKLYAECYAKVWTQIHSLPGHENDQVVVAALSPFVYRRWKLAKNPFVRPLDYFTELLDELRKTGIPIDALALHAYTQTSDPELIFSEQMFSPDEPLFDHHYEFRVYRDFMNKIPVDLRYVPVYITEAAPIFISDNPSRGQGWPDDTRGWIQNAYQEINDWNTTPGNQQIHAILLYRWFGDQWEMHNKPALHADFQAAMDHEYVWLDTQD